MQRWFLLSLSLTLGMLAVMSLWSFPQITAAAGGLLAFDLRVNGYTATQGIAFLNALTDEGRQFYLTTQHRLDFIFPICLAATLMLAARIVFRRRFATVVYCVALMGLASDFLENRTIAALLRMPENIDPVMIEAANIWTLAKFGLLVVALALLVIGGLRRVWRFSWVYRGAS